jgi:hypothetical protein
MKITYHSVLQVVSRLLHHLPLLFGIILFPSYKLAAHQVPPEVVALPAGERLEALDNRIAEIKWRLETEEIILDRLNKLNLQVRVLMQ